MEKGEQEGRQKEWKSPSGVDGETNQILVKKGIPGYRGYEGKRKKAVLRYGREGIGSNEEWEYTIKVEKSYGEIISGTHITLLREYAETLFGIVDKMGHTIHLIPYLGGTFEHGISDMAKLELKKKYIGSVVRKPKFNHIEIKIRIVTSLKLEN